MVKIDASDARCPLLMQTRNLKFVPCPVLRYRLHVESMTTPKGTNAVSKRTIEVFTAGCHLCDEAVEQVRALACPSCELVVHDLAVDCEDNTCIDRARELRISKVPAVVVEGSVAHCCSAEAISYEGLKALGIGAVA